MPRNEIEPLMTAEEVARILRVAPKTVRNKAASGQIPSVRVAGGVSRFRRQDIARLIDQAATADMEPAA